MRLTKAPQRDGGFDAEAVSARAPGPGRATATPTISHRKARRRQRPGRHFRFAGHTPQVKRYRRLPLRDDRRADTLEALRIFAIGVFIQWRTRSS